MALARFVDESIIRPSAAERPVWASDPRFALIWQLKSFFYAYGQNIVGGVARESISRRAETGSNTGFASDLRGKIVEERRTASLSDFGALLGTTPDTVL